MVTGLLKQLLEAGVHFGHQTRRWNPKMAKYIFGEKNGVYIIDLEKTVKALEEACKFLTGVVSKGGYVLFAGTKRQAQEIIQGEAERCGMFYVNYRWLGGTLTNFATISKRVSRLKELTEMKENGEFENMRKKEAMGLNKELEKLNKNLSGIAKMERIPDCLFIVDPKREHTALKEAVKLSIPVISLVDTDCDPDTIDYVIPGNDDAIRSITLVCSLIADTIAKGSKKFKEGKQIEEKKVQEETPKKETPKEEKAAEPAKPEKKSSKK